MTDEHNPAANFGQNGAFEVTEQATRQDARSLPENWTGYSQHSRDCTPLPTKYITAKEVLQFRDQAFLKYYTNLGYLNMVESRFGVETREHITDMTKYKLQRDLIEGKSSVPLVTLPAEDPQPDVPSDVVPILIPTTDGDRKTA